MSKVSMPGLATYTATKAFVSNFIQALHYEVRSTVDVTCWDCGPTLTNLFGNEPPVGGKYFAISPE